MSCSSASHTIPIHQTIMIIVTQVSNSILSASFQPEICMKPYILWTRTYLTHTYVRIYSLEDVHIRQLKLTSLVAYVGQAWCATTSRCHMCKVNVSFGFMSSCKHAFLQPIYNKLLLYCAIMHAVLALEHCVDCVCQCGCHHVQPLISLSEYADPCWFCLGQLLVFDNIN